MKGYTDHIEKLTLENTNFRKVLYTSESIQLVLMRLGPGEEIGSEVHDVDQFFRFEAGEGKVVVNDTDSHVVCDGDVYIVPAGTQHNITNTSVTEDLKLYTVYSPPHHKDGVVHPTKTDALNDDEEFDGITSEKV